MPISTELDSRRTHAASRQAGVAHELVVALQHRLVENLEEVALPLGDDGFSPIDWLRDQGRHGGGRRYAAAQSVVFNRASVNVSGVHYDDLEDKKLRSATALSTIIHPDNPHAPSMHMHISWTELRDGRSYWRLMADLNPSREASWAQERFDAAVQEVLQQAGPDLVEEATAQGDRYFFIPALNRHRGVSHYYLEGYDSGDFDTDRALAEGFGDAVIDVYSEILSRALHTNPEPTEEEVARQRAYHTVYVFQALTLDRGTTSGILVHDQNDVGILASLPSFIDRPLLESYQEKMESPQDLLLSAILQKLPRQSPCPITDDTRRELARVVRSHYREHPEALAMQASGTIKVATVENHQG